MESSIPEEQWQSFSRQIQRLAPINDPDLSLLRPDVREVALSKGACFVEEGRKASTVGFVLEGNMRQFYTSDGEEKTTYFFFENHLVSGYISCLTGQPSLVTIEALSACRLLVFDYEVLTQLYQRSPAWQEFGRLLAEYLVIGLEERMVGLLTLSPEARYAQLLGSGKDKIIERIPQHYIANYLGITPVSLSRIRNRLVKRK